MKPFFAAVQFLTIFPLPASWGGGEQELSRSVAFFPVVGLLIGVLVATLDYGLARIFPQLLSSVFVVIALLGVSGGLHIDGLADTADGFFSSRPREQMLEIMRDSRTGPMGVAAVVCVISMKIAAVASIPSPLRWGTILLIPLAGRCAMVVEMAVLPYVRPEGGLGTVFQRSGSRLHAAGALAALALVGWLATAWMGVAAWAASLAVTLILAAYAYRKIGGLTGDVLGASCEIVEVIPALVAVAWAHGGGSVW